MSNIAVAVYKVHLIVHVAQGGCYLNVTEVDGFMKVFQTRKLN
jgi:hypothetical protein